MLYDAIYIYIYIYGAVRLIVCLNRYNLGPKTGGDKSCEFYPLWVHFVGLCSSLFVLSCFHFYWICPSSHYDLLLDGLKIYNLISAPWWGRGERGRERGGDFPNVSLYTSYTFIYLYIFQTPTIYFHIPPHTSKYPILGIRGPTLDPKIVIYLDIGRFQR